MSKHRTGKLITGEEFAGFENLKVNNLVYFTDEIEKQAFNGVTVLWKITAIAKDFQMMRLKGLIPHGQDLKEVDVVTYDIPPQSAPPSQGEPPAEAA